MVSGLAMPLASHHGHLLTLHLGNSEWKGLCFLGFLPSSSHQGLKLTFSLCLVIQQQAYLDVKHANRDSVKGGQVQRVPEHSKPALVLLLSVWAPGVDRCAYLIPCYQEGRKMPLSLQLGQAEGVPSILACFKNLLHLWMKGSLLSQDAPGLSPKQESCQEFRQLVPLLHHFLKAGLTSAGPQLLLDAQ